MAPLAKRRPRQSTINNLRIPSGTALFSLAGGNISHIVTSVHPDSP
jgi:hypothetical protein